MPRHYSGYESINRGRTNIFCFVVLKRNPLINVDHEETGIFVSLTGSLRKTWAHHNICQKGKRRWIQESNLHPITTSPGEILDVLQLLSFPPTPHTVGWLPDITFSGLSFWTGLDACHRLGPLDANPEIRIHVLVNVFRGITDRGMGKREQKGRRQSKDKTSSSLRSGKFGSVLPGTSGNCVVTSQRCLIQGQHLNFRMPVMGKGCPPKLQVLHTHGKKSGSLELVL